MSKRTAPENVVIIGGGPAGLAAAIYTARAGIKPLLFAGSPPGGQLTLTSDVENYPGYESILGPELIEKMRKQAEIFGTRVFNENILDVNFTKELKLKVSDSTFKKVTQSEGNGFSEIVAKAVIIATGAKALWLGLDSEQQLRGKGVSACATCDGFFFKNKVVAVVGGGDTAMEEALTLTKFASKVYLIHRRDFFRASKIMQERVLNHEHIEVIYNAQIDEVLGDMKVDGIKLSPVEKPSLEKNELKIDGLFVAIGHKPDTELFKKHVMCDKKGYILTSAQAAIKYTKNNIHKELAHENVDIAPFNLAFQTATSVNGVFAAGDCVDHVYRQAATAAGMGVGAALDVERWLNE